jgi:hypothetical protein
MSVRSRLVAATAVGLIAIGSVAGASTAMADGPSSPTSGSAVTGARLGHACSRLPGRITRLQKVQTRLHADAATKGSIAFLQARIDKATADGNTDLAKLLSDRMAVRKDIDAALPDVLTHLQDAQAICAAHRKTAPSASASS